MNINEITTPHELMTFLDKSIRYGVIDNSDNKFYDSSTSDFQDACNNSWKVRPVSQIINDGIGHCYDQVEVERFWFEKHNYIVKTFWISAYQKEIENSGFAHTYLMFKENGRWKLFEHADYKNKGIYEFDSLEKAIDWQASNQIEFAKSCVKPINKYDVAIYEYKKPQIGLTMREFLDHVVSGKQIDIEK